MFDASDIVWMDFEAASSLDLKAVGTFRYATDASTRAIVLAYAIGNGPLVAWHADGAILDWDDNAPDDLRAAFDRGATFAAWNASFDAAVWNYATLGFPSLPPERVIDVMIQAGVSNLPTDLESASRALGGEGKQKDGKALIRLFCVEGAAPSAHPEKWQCFLTYACRDVGAMRDAYRKTRPLPREEWQQYWAFEHVNRRGVAVDLPFVRRAAALAVEDADASGHRLDELTGGAVTRVTQAKRIATWLYDNLADTAIREVITVGIPADDGDDVDEDEAEPQEFSLTRDRVARVLAMLDTKHANGGLDPAETRAHEVATLRLYGAGASPKKFARIDAQQVDGVLRGQYRFAGAGQTGRLSSRGAQIHNLTRDVLGEDGVAEAPLVDAIADGCSYAALAAAEPVDVPPARKLALIVRPALIAGPGKVFVGSDWSAIEARITPWLAASPDAERVLDIFRANDSDPSRPDIYTVAAAGILHKNDPSGVTKSERNIGKVATLALGFGGSVGALQRMALNYRISLDDAEARRIVDAWREANPWAREFWGLHRDGESYGLWGAAMTAWELPGQTTTAGRIAFVYREDYLGGALFMALPSGRLLTYPRPRWRDVDILDSAGKPTGERRSECSFRRARGRAKLWHGTLCENCIAEGTPVLTERGWAAVETITNERIWDGEDFVAHGGVVCSGLQSVIDFDGVAITPDHLILTTEGWRHAREGHRFERAPVRLPSRARDAWHVAASSLFCLAFDEGSLPAADASGLTQLRGPRNLGLRPLAGELRELLGGHGADLQIRVGYRPDQQYARLRTGELSLGDAQSGLSQYASQSHHRDAVGPDDNRGSVGAERHWQDDALLSSQANIRPVFDILNAGHHHRFVIATRGGPLIVHNCVQATAADLLRQAVTRIETNPALAWMPIRMTTHDEIVVEVDETAAGEAKAILRREMLTLPDWAAGLPLQSEEASCPYYSKSKAALK